MARSKTRQRKLAREKYERQMARRAQKQRRRRQLQAGLGVFLTLALIAVGSAWWLGAFEKEEEPVVPDACTWLPQDITANPDRIEVGMPDPNPSTDGVRTMTVGLDAGELGTGEVEAVLELADAPCAAASIDYLAAEGFYDDVVCHELYEGSALRCGDPTGTGLGGPTYAYYGENIPPLPVENEDEDEDAPLMYPRGTLAMGDVTGQHGSQFLLFFEDFHTDTPLFSIIGTVTDGLDLLEQIGAAGTADSGEEDSVTAPAHEVRLTGVTITDPDAGDDEIDDES